MDLKSYIDSRKLGIEEMAERIGGVTGAAVRHWVIGARMPSPEIAERIVDATEGVVTVLDMHNTRLSFVRSNPAKQGDEAAA